MLSNISIQKFLDSGDIIISPWSDDMMDGCRVTIHLGEIIIIPDAVTTVDVQKKTLPNYREVTITSDSPFKLEPGSFILGRTRESIGLSEKISGMIDGRSTLARVGLQITQTAMIIDPGQNPKTMTLEIFNAGPNPILLYPNMKFGRVCFFELNPPATMRADVTGKYVTGDKDRPILKDEIKK